MQENILLSWKFWVQFYLYLCYLWSLIFIVEHVFKVIVARIMACIPAFQSELSIAEIEASVSEFEERLSGRRGDTIFDLFYFFRYLLYSLTFLSSLSIKLLSFGINIFTFEHFLCFLFAFI